MIVHLFAATKPVKVIRTRNEVLPCAVANIYQPTYTNVVQNEPGWRKVSDQRSAGFTLHWRLVEGLLDEEMQLESQ